MTSLIPAIAQEVAERFPELEGRSIAVSEIEPFNNNTNVPSLPMAFTALVTERADQNPRGGSGVITLTSDVLIHFAFPPIKYKNVKGNDLPFFAFYDYEPLRNKLLAMASSWRAPGNLGLSYRSMDVEADEYAVYIAFRFHVVGDWCMPDAFNEEPAVLDAVLKMCTPQSTIPCPPLCEEPEPPCNPPVLNPQTE